MHITICGLRHLGVITSACLINHFDVSVWEPDERIVQDLHSGKLPFPHKEPGFPGAFPEHIAGNCESLQDAIPRAEIVWVAFDTPVDQSDVADYGFIREQIERIYPYLHNDQIVLISSQVPVGFTRKRMLDFQRLYPDVQVTFAHSPENIRRGKGLETFCRQDRIVIGLDQIKTQTVQTLSEMFRPFCENLAFMSLESAEMTKHALNAYLGMSIAFANEIAEACRLVGADVEQVELGFRTEGRIGTKLPLRSGEPFTGGTLGRDLKHLEKLLPDGVIASVRKSNLKHRDRLIPA